MLAAEAVLYFAKDILAAISLLLILKYILSETYSGSGIKYILAAVGAALYTAAAYLFLLPLTSHAYEILDAVSNAFCILCAFVFFRKPAKLRTLAVLFLYYFTVDMLWSFLAPFFGNSIIAELIFDLLLFTAMCAVVLISSSDGVSILAGVFAKLPKWVITVLLLFELTCYYKEFGVSDVWYNILYAISAILIIVCIAYLLYRLSHLTYTQNSILRQLDEQLLYSDALKHSDEQLRSFRHDLKNHIIVINSMFEQGDIRGAEKYFSQLKEDNASSLKHYSTGNTVVDSLLDVKSSAAAADNIQIDFSGIVPSAGIEAKDMCICVGNLLDNAVEACEKLTEASEKIIYVTGKFKNKTLVLTVRNPATINGNIRPGTTSKSDKRLHGIGLKNVKKIAEKYGGTVSLESDGNVFTAVLLMQCSPAPSA